MGTALSTMKAAVSVHVDIREAQQSRTAVYSDDSADGEPLHLTAPSQAIPVTSISL